MLAIKKLLIEADTKDHSISLLTVGCMIIIWIPNAAANTIKNLHGCALDTSLLSYVDLIDVGEPATS